MGENKMWKFSKRPWMLFCAENKAARREIWENMEVRREILVFSFHCCARLLPPKLSRRLSSEYGWKFEISLLRILTKSSRSERKKIFHLFLNAKLISSPPPHSYHSELTLQSEFLLFQSIVDCLEEGYWTATMMSTMSEQVADRGKLRKNEKL